MHPAGNEIGASAAAGSVADETPQPSWRSRLLRAAGLVLAAAGLFGGFADKAAVNLCRDTDQLWVTRVTRREARSARP